MKKISKSNSTAYGLNCTAGQRATGDNFCVHQKCTSDFSNDIDLYTYNRKKIAQQNGMRDFNSIHVL